MKGGANLPISLTEVREPFHPRSDVGYLIGENVRFDEVCGHFVPGASKLLNGIRDHVKAT